MKALVLVLISSWLGGVASAPAAGNDPETVLVIYYIKEGKADAFGQLLDRTWLTYKRLGTVFDRPHIVMRGNENGVISMAEILT
jgi:hypothetical protein